MLTLCYCLKVLYHLIPSHDSIQHVRLVRTLCSPISLELVNKYSLIVIRPINSFLALMELYSLGYVVIFPGLIVVKGKLLEFFTLNLNCDDIIFPDSGPVSKASIATKAWADL